MCLMQGVSPLSSHSASEAGHRGGPAVGVRLVSQRCDHVIRGRTSLSQVNDHERVKSDKFTSLLSAANVNLGEAECDFFCFM